MLWTGKQHLLAACISLLGLNAVTITSKLAHAQALAAHALTTTGPPTRPHAHPCHLCRSASSGTH